MQKTPMAQFARHRTLTEVLKLAAEKGYKVDAMRHTHNGSDHITVFMPAAGGKVVPVLYNVFSGRFFSAGREAFSYFASDRTEHEDEPWFKDMLEFFYVSTEAE